MILGQRLGIGDVSDVRDHEAGEIERIRLVLTPLLQRRRPCDSILHGILLNLLSEHILSCQRNFRGTQPLSDDLMSVLVHAEVDGEQAIIGKRQLLADRLADEGVLAPAEDEI